MGTNAKEYLSKVPFKEKVNEYTSKASNLFKRTPAPAAAAPPSAPTESKNFIWEETAPKPKVKPEGTTIKPRAATAPKPAAPPSAPAGSTAR